MADPISLLMQPLQTLYVHPQMENAQHSLKSLGRSSADRSDAKLQAACQEMESLFLSYLLKEMRATINRSGLISGGTAEEIFTSMLDTELAKGISGRGGIGLSKILLDQLGRELGKKDGLKHQR